MAHKFPDHFERVIRHDVAIFGTGGILPTLETNDSRLAKIETTLEMVKAFLSVVRWSAAIGLYLVLRAVPDPQASQLGTALDNLRSILGLFSGI